MNQNKIVVVGIGHPFRSDDALGLKAIEYLQKKLPTTVQTRTLLADPTELLEFFSEFSHVYLIDAIYSQTVSPGTLFRLDGFSVDNMSTNLRASTHAFDIGQVLQLAENLHLIPHKLVIYGIEAKSFSQGDCLSDEVNKNFTVMIEQIVDEVTKDLRRNSNA